MSGEEKKAKAKHPLIKLIIALIVLAVTVFTVGDLTGLPGFPSWGDVETTIKNVEAPMKTVDGFMQMHVIDVGQGDSCLIKCGGRYILVDAGDNGKGKVVNEYLSAHSVTHLDWVIATHPDSDHIGGMDEVLNSSVTVGNFMMPKLPDTIKPTSQTYEELLQAVADKGLKITQPLSGMSYLLDGAVMRIMSESNGFTNENDYSIVLKITYGDVSFLLTGDAETEAEKHMVEKWQEDLKADVIKVGHHGSKNSSSNEFLQAVQPKYAVISVGQGNKYGHPADDTLLKLKGMNARIYRTDYSGDIVFSTNGKNIEVETER